MTKTKFLLALKFTAEKIMPKIGKLDHRHHFFPYFCPVLQFV